jgi:hypothetical protein
MSQGYSSPPQSSGGGNTLVIVLVTLGVVVLLCAGICGGCYLLANRVVTEAGKQIDKLGDAAGELVASAAMHTQATMQVQQNAQVIEKLGMPLEITATSMPNLDPKATTASLVYTVKGPKGTATARGEGKREGNGWKITSLQVQFADGTTADIDVDQPFQIPLGGSQPGLPEIPIPDVPKPESPITPPSP